MWVMQDPPDSAFPSVYSAKGKLASCGFWKRDCAGWDPGGQRASGGRGQNQAKGEANAFQPARRGEVVGERGDAEPLALKQVYWVSFA